MATIPFASRWRARIAKTAFGIAVFTTTIASYAALGDVVRTQLPLPGGIGLASPCTIWFVGSSSINKWRTLDADMAPWPVRNRGVDGALLDELRSRFAHDLAVSRPAAIVYYAGENDIAYGVSAADTVRAMLTLIDEQAMRAPGVPVFVVAMKPSPTRWGLRAEQLRYDALMRAAAVRRPAVRFLDISKRLLVGARPGPFYVKDGVHLNEAGYARWGDGIRRGFEAALPPGMARTCRSKMRAS